MSVSNLVEGTVGCHSSFHKYSNYPKFNINVEQTNVWLPQYTAADDDLWSSLLISLCRLKEQTVTCHWLSEELSAAEQWGSLTSFNGCLAFHTGLLRSIHFKWMSLFRLIKHGNIPFMQIYFSARTPQWFFIVLNWILYLILTWPEVKPVKAIGAEVVSYPVAPPASSSCGPWLVALSASPANTQLSGLSCEEGVNTIHNQLIVPPPVLGWIIPHRQEDVWSHAVVVRGTQEAEEGSFFSEMKLFLIW